MVRGRNVASVSLTMITRLHGGISFVLLFFFYPLRRLHSHSYPRHATVVPAQIRPRANLSDIRDPVFIGVTCLSSAL
jgi:hypothetical protein